jgi:hypothetical protein
LFRREQWAVRVVTFWAMLSRKEDGEPMLKRCLIELCGYESGAGRQAERQIRDAGHHSGRWGIWSPSMIWEGRLPDISAIDTQGKSWSEVFRHVNAAHGAYVVLIGEDAPRVGLPVLPADSGWDDLDEVLPADSLFGAEALPCTVPAELSADSRRP